MEFIRLAIFVGILLPVISAATALRCYSCTSYMNQCKEVVAKSPSHVGRNKCSTKCFIRTGEDGATYRGCFDEFARVVRLQANYIGCRNQTWNNRSLRWCFCATELCNGVGMETLETMTQSAPTQPELPVLHIYTNTTRPAMLNTDHGVFKYIEEEAEEVKGEMEDGAIKSRPPVATKGLVKGRLRSNAVPTKVVKPNRSLLKQLNGEEYYELIDKPVESVSPRRTAIEQAIHVRHDLSRADRVRPSEPLNRGPDRVRPSEPLNRGPDRVRPSEPLNRGLIVAAKQDDEILDRDYEPNDLDYPYNQDMRSISKIVEKLSRVENGHHEEELERGSFRSSDEALPNREVSKSKAPQPPEVQLKSAKVKSHYDEPLPFKNHVSSELASKMTCEESGYYQHPTDCTLYMACVYDPYTRSPIWHLMRCPELLFWDNERKICVEFSINCPKGEGIEKPIIHKFN